MSGLMQNGCALPPACSIMLLLRDLFMFMLARELSHPKELSKNSPQWDCDRLVNSVLAFFRKVIPCINAFLFNIIFFPSGFKKPLAEKGLAKLAMVIFTFAIGTPIANVKSRKAAPARFMLTLDVYVVLVHSWKNSTESVPRQIISHHGPRNMSRGADTGMSLAPPPAIHVGPILNPGTNQTISIVIPLSAQLATVSTQAPEKSCKDCGKDVNSVSSKCAMNRVRNDKTKGCPFPTCVRYGRAFSRAHDLKRHIARHEMRKEKLSDIEKGHSAGVITGHVTTESISHKDRPYNLAGRDEQRDSVIKTYSCLNCKKRYISENKLRAHMSTHEKIPANNVCVLCNTQFQNDGALQEHMKHHTTHMLQTQVIAEKTHVPYQKDVTEKDDDFLLEEMLLLNKNSKRSTLGKGNANAASKIKCDYCLKTFKTKWTLSSHVAAHEGRFQFDCSQCGKKFVRKSHYEGHVRSHEAARPYTCEQCGKTFKELKHRREHTKRKHPSNQNAIQSLLDSINPCSTEEMPVDQAKFTLLMPMNFSA